ncbi:MAG: hypothetical protein H6698_05380 [Myxococcales bacterium]|nr:hypothetical protein [Myxococcales bacterium]MCB9530221.1 hypothetical protein [Myxococcales bacterium]MCB9533734.1 hypothetical protein [Myxococcales bacterium]
MSLEQLIDNGAPIGELAAYLDGLTHEVRAEQTLALNRKRQIALWERAADGPPITLEHFVPAALAPLTEVIHHGRNTLPAFKQFQKRFCRPSDGSARAFGYNEGATRALIGPGYFVMIPTAGNAEWEARGAWVVDYFQVPEAAVVEGWPKVVDNSQGLQVFVYNKTRDFMRRVSSHVSIGAAFKVEKQMGAYFVLVREDR